MASEAWASVVVFTYVKELAGRINPPPVIDKQSQSRANLAEVRFSS
jgi:hypothetical protein